MTGKLCVRVAALSENRVADPLELPQPSCVIKPNVIQASLPTCESSSIFGIAEGRNEYEWGGHPARAKMKRARCPFHGKMPVPQNY
ncbi:MULTISPECIES: hypothetical protein [Moorena]|uniref:hypothetical protein n=1 Tax=Moorena TaxID=1155738 RepID=UPI0010559D1A|nr:MULTISPECIES: hypothetical protein [Moorena]NEP35167.1 hypothetical protein [Moorena sp. SIO3B2]NEQ15812.1 hypothetical protein [Moorena sp. SIO3E2]NES44260.1 hypothetical protein [Moorena sp. SIO2C4]